MDDMTTPRDWTAEPCFWTATRMRILAGLFEQGCTRREMAGILGVSRCACIGKLHRMGLVVARPVLPGDEARRRRLDRRNMLARAKTAAARAAGIPPPRPPWKPRPRVAEPAQEVSAQPVDICGLTEKTCRWPLWSDRGLSPVKMYCGADVLTGCPYCATHFKLSQR